MENVSNLVNEFNDIEFIDKNKEKINSDSLIKINIIGLYFTSSWCPPCMEFRETLLKFYNEINTPNKVFEIIQISNEKYQHEFDNSLNEPWLYIQFNDDHMYDLVDHYKIDQLPTLKIVNREKIVISDKGRKDILDFGIKSYEKWYKRYREIKDQDNEN